MEQDDIIIHMSETNSLPVLRKPGTWPPGVSGNPAGRKTAGAYIKEWINILANCEISELRKLAHDQSIPAAKQIAAQRLYRAAEDPDLADFETLTDGTQNPSDLRRQGVDTSVIRKCKSKRRTIPNGDDTPIVEIEMEIELHNRGGEEFDRVMENTHGKPGLAPDAPELAAGPPIVFFDASMSHEAIRNALAASGSHPAALVDVQAQPDQDAVIADSSDNSPLGDKTAQLDDPGSTAVGGVDVQAGGITDEMVAAAPRLGSAFLALRDCRDKFVLVESRRGTGKTYAILSILTERALTHTGSRWLVVRSSRTRLTNSAISTFIDMVLPAFRLPVPTCSREQISTYKLPNGSEFIFQGLDDPNRQQSVEVSGVYVVEGVEIDSLDTITALAGSMRKVSNPPVPVYQVIVDCNPGAPTHPLNLIAEPAGDDLRVVTDRSGYDRVIAFDRAPSAAAGKWKRIISHFADNPAYFSVPEWKFTPMGENYLDTLSWLTGHLKSQWLHGLWTMEEGSVFGGVFDVKVHVVDDFEPPADWPLHVGWDPGIDHVTGMPWVWVSPTGDIFVGDEVYEGGKTIQEHVDSNVRRRMKGRTVSAWWGDPHHFFSVTAQAKKSCADQAQEAGLSRAWEWSDLRGSAKVAGVNAILQLLQNTVAYEKGQRRGPCLYVMRRCINTIMEMQTWAYKRNLKGEQLDGDEKYEDRNNHILDGIIGMWATGRLVWKEGSERAEVCPNG